ncbi:TPA: DUF4354 family protein [Serratia marcescens]
MKKLLLLASLLAYTQSGIASEQTSPLNIQATNLSDGTITSEGKIWYIKQLNLIVENTGNKEINLSDRYGCYKAMNKNGEKFETNGAQVELFKKLKPGEHTEGKITFRSDNESVYNARFVYWNDNCSYLKK